MVNKTTSPKIHKEQIGVLEVVSTEIYSGAVAYAIHVPQFPPEKQATLGAALSRSLEGVIKRLKIVNVSQKILDSVIEEAFKKYAHGSIGDMGTIIFSLEGVSMKGAFDSLEHPLFNGQERSTRYKDFSNTGFLSVNNEVDALSKKSFEIFSEVKDSVFSGLVQGGMTEGEAEPAMFDIAGGFLPISARTDVFHFLTLRVAIDVSRRMISMGGENRKIGKSMSYLLDTICPRSRREVSDNHLEGELILDQELSDFFYKKIGMNSSGVNFENFDLRSFENFFKDRDLVISKLLASFGTISAVFAMDYRSFRDVHRHRAFPVNVLVNYQPKGLEDFYIKSICDQNLREKICKTGTEIVKQASDLEDGYYAMPMATKFPCLMTGTLPAWLYFLWLRSGPKVHPTVLDRAQKIGNVFENVLRKDNLYHKGNTDYSARSGDKNDLIDRYNK